MIYIYQKNNRLEPHTDKNFAENTLGLGSPIATLTEEEWDRAEGLARLIDGEIFLGKTDAEKADEKAQEVRATRDRLLKETDWTQVTDSPLYGNPEILAYRQALRDITDKEGFPYVEMPER